MLKTITEDEFFKLWVRVDTNFMSQTIFGLPYTELKKVIYPQPSYKTFLIAKRNGNHRIINEPKPNLKKLQEYFLAFLYENSGPFKKCVHGFTHERSIVTNAKQHCSIRTNHILNIDIKDFFPSITFYRVRGLLMNNPFNFSYPVATVLAHLSCHNNCLPQGAPTSPILANLICRKLDKDLMALAQRHQATYTRYCDDITFSFSTKDPSRLPKNICSFESGVAVLGDEIEQIFIKNSFLINNDKTRISNPRNRLEVTGLTINQFPNVKRVYVDEIRGALNAWEKHGYIDATAGFESRIYVRRTRSAIFPSISNYLWGKLLFLKMVKGIDDTVYNKLARKYNHLSVLESQHNSNFNLRLLPISSIVINKTEANHSTFVIECRGTHPTLGYFVSQGTAFAYGRVGFITCEHVLRKEQEYYEDFPDKEMFILDPQTKQQWNIKVEHKDPHFDLAIIQVTDLNPPNCKRFSGRGTSLEIGKKGYVLGFPNYSYGKKVANHVETKIINQYNMFALTRLEVNETIRQGNSGGPLVDEQYRLAGVVQKGATIDSSNNECLDVVEVDRWIDKYLESKKLYLEKQSLIIKLLEVLTKVRDFKISH